MDLPRRTVLTVTVVVVGLLSAYLLSAILGTVLLGLASGYVLLPYRRWLRRRGLSPYWASVTAAASVAAATVLAAVPVGYVIYVRRRAIVAALGELPSTVLVDVGDEAIELDLSPITGEIVPNFSRLAVDLAGSIALLSAKLVVFVFVIFAVLYYEDALRPLALRVVPVAYHEPMDRIKDRVRDVLVGHFAIRFAGAAVVYVVGGLMFVALGSELPFAVSLLAAVLYLLPIVNPSWLVAGLTVGHLANGAVIEALSLLALGVPGLVLVPYAFETWIRSATGYPTKLSPVLYFLGFVGGGVTAGFVGFVAGPLVLAVLDSVASMLADPGSAS